MLLYCTPEEKDLRSGIAGDNPGNDIQRETVCAVYNIPGSASSGMRRTSPGLPLKSAASIIIVLFGWIPIAVSIMFSGLSLAFRITMCRLGRVTPPAMYGPTPSSVR